MPLTNIAPGSKVKIKVVKTPTSRAGRITLTRLLRKDRALKSEDQRLRRIRRDGFTQKQRGGRFWDTHLVAQPVLVVKEGVTQTITASLDVLRDLKSVERFVEVTKA